MGDVVSSTPNRDRAAYIASEEALAQVHYGVIEKKGPKGVPQVFESKSKNAAPTEQTEPSDKRRYRPRVGATGTAPLTYQWFEGTAPDTTKPIAGATGSSYVTTIFNVPGTYRYWVRVRNACNQNGAISATAVLTVPCASPVVPSISVPPTVSAQRTNYRVSWSLAVSEAEVTEVGLFADRAVNLSGLPSGAMVTIYVTARNNSGETSATKVDVRVP
jgi:hypothetical protein